MYMYGCVGSDRGDRGEVRLSSGEDVSISSVTPGERNLDWFSVLAYD